MKNIKLNLLLALVVSLAGLSCGKKNEDLALNSPHPSFELPENCLTPEECQKAVQQKKETIENQLDSVPEGTRAYLNMRLEQNFLSEVEHLNSSSPQREKETNKLKKKYSILAKNIEDSANKSTLIYHPRSLEQVLDVQKTFGEFFIKETDGYVSVETETKPWSGYWYPFSNSSLYEGDKSPLYKIDKILELEGLDSKIQSTEKELQETISFAESWEGHCDAWATASVLTKEPSRSIVTTEGVELSISDQKALLVKLHEKVKKIRYGISYRGDLDSDGTYQDTRPELFHQIVSNYLENNQAIMIDDTAGIEVWTKPVFAMRWKVDKDPEIENAFLITSIVTLMSERHSVSNELTSRSDEILVKYQYRFYVDLDDQNERGYQVLAGEWIGESAKTHPDTIDIPILESQLGSSNSEINKYIEEINKILTLGTTN